MNNDMAWTGLMDALKHEALKLVAEDKDLEAVRFYGKYLADGRIPAKVPTFAEQVAKAGGRIVRL